MIKNLAVGVQEGKQKCPRNYAGKLKKAGNKNYSTLYFLSFEMSKTCQLQIQKNEFLMVQDLCASVSMEVKDK